MVHLFFMIQNISTVLTCRARKLFVLGWVGGCPVHCRMFRSILDLYPLDAGTCPLSQGMTIQNGSRHLPMSPGEQNCWQLSSTISILQMEKPKLREVEWLVQVTYHPVVCQEQGCKFFSDIPAMLCYVAFKKKETWILNTVCFKMENHSRQTCFWNWRWHKKQYVILKGSCNGSMRTAWLWIPDAFSGLMVGVIMQ